MDKKLTPRDIDYYMPGPAMAVTIPKGTEVRTATNLPQGSIIAFWVEPWEGMSEAAATHQRTYGFGIRQEDMDGDSEAVPVGAGETA